MVSESIEKVPGHIFAHLDYRPTGLGGGPPHAPLARRVYHALLYRVGSGQGGLWSVGVRSEGG